MEALSLTLNVFYQTLDCYKSHFVFLAKVLYMGDQIILVSYWNERPQGFSEKKGLVTGW